MDEEAHPGRASQHLERLGKAVGGGEKRKKTIRVAELSRAVANSRVRPKRIKGRCARSEEANRDHGDKDFRNERPYFISTVILSVSSCSSLKETMSNKTTPTEIPESAILKVGQAALSYQCQLMKSMT